MESQIVILGSGTCVPSLLRNPSSFLMRTREENLLFDCGAGVMRRLLEAGVSIFDISHLFLSHFHPDHIGELAAFLFALKYPKPSPQKRKLTIFAGTGFSRFFEKLKGVYGHWITLPPDRLAVVELDTAGYDHFDTPFFQVTSLPVAHRPESLAYRVEDAAGRVLVYSGDSDDCDNLIKIADHADMLVCEAAYPDGQKVDGHLIPSLAGRIARAAAVRCLVLTHFYPACDAVDIEKQCRSTYNGPIVLARDLMRLTL
ncbi:Beta-lactamase domain protein [Desulfosarcina cetonica]|uniref:MBL fold metallo-hydrolase n=1 Tax=Desulfosarcina cetonica TaxID=90730 RepID=UPI0006D18095|nr:MBL fold metallo-hydrolase [Desulfosarcina cetonica]VTR69225.1 Beta-lactamase domain protein [Desulfosarcina cetonica]